MAEGEKTLRSSVSRYLSPSSLIDAARSADPSFKYAIVVAGLAALVATVVNFGVSLATLVFGVIILIGLMVLYVVFAQIPKLARSSLALSARVFVWTVLLVVVAIIVMLTTSAFFNYPIPIRDAIIRSIIPTKGNIITEIDGSNEDFMADDEGNEVTRSLVTQDILDIYRDVGQRGGFLNHWAQSGADFTVQNFNISFRSGARIIGTDIDPAKLPSAVHLTQDNLERVGAEAAPRVASFLSKYGSYKASMRRLNEAQGDKRVELVALNSDSNELIKRGRIALCTLGQTPPRLFESGGFDELQPDDCEGI